MKRLKKTESAFELGYCLHRYLPPKAIQLVAAEYDKRGIPAVIQPSDNGSWPSIWGVYPLRQKKAGAIYRKLKNQIQLAETAFSRKGAK